MAEHYSQIKHLTPNCPLCGGPPMLGGLFTPFICEAEDCKVLSWNPERSLDENMCDMQFVDLSNFEPYADDEVEITATIDPAIDGWKITVTTEEKTDE